MGTDGSISYDQITVASDDDFEESGNNWYRQLLENLTGCTVMIALANSMTQHGTVRPWANGQPVGIVILQKGAQDYHIRIDSIAAIAVTPTKD